MIQNDGTKLPSLIDAHEIASMHDAATHDWHRLAPPNLITLDPPASLDKNPAHAPSGKFRTVAPGGRGSFAVFTRPRDCLRQADD